MKIQLEKENLSYQPKNLKINKIYTKTLKWKFLKVEEKELHKVRQFRRRRDLTTLAIQNKFQSE